MDGFVAKPYGGFSSYPTLSDMSLPMEIWLVAAEIWAEIMRLAVVKERKTLWVF